MESYTEILTAMSMVFPTLLTVPQPLVTESRKSKLIVLTPGLRERALRKRALKAAGLDPKNQPAA